MISLEKIFLLKYCFTGFNEFTGKSETKLCPDGLVFADEHPNKEHCDIPSNVECDERKELRESYMFYTPIFFRYNYSIYASNQGPFLGL